MQQDVLKLLEQLSNTNIFFGPQGFAFSDSESALAKLQETYNFDGWLSSWFVIARDTEMGDPYFVDITQPGLPVYTAIHGEGTWQSELISETLEGFVACMESLFSISEQTFPQVIPDESTIQNIEQLTALEISLSNKSNCNEFWQTFFACYMDWLSDDF